MQRHAPARSLAVQSAFCPQGEGLQGSIGAGAGAGINNYINIILQHFPNTLTSGDSGTASEGVSCVSRITATLGNVIGNMTGGVVATHPWTWVNTVLGHTGQMPGTLGVDDTLWFTLDIRVPSVVSDTSTAGSLALLSTESVDPTGRGTAWLDYDWQDGTWGRKWLTRAQLVITNSYLVATGNW